MSKKDTKKTFFRTIATLLVMDKSIFFVVYPHIFTDEIWIEQ